MYEDTSKYHLDKRVRIENGDKTWHEKFKEIKAELKELIGDEVIYIEHVGTTAATDIMACPALDVAVSVTNKEHREKVAKILEASHKSYHRAKSHNDEILIRRGTIEKPEYYVHIAETDSDFYQSMVRFAKELKVSPKARYNYQNVHIFAKDNYYNSPDKYFHAKRQSIMSALGRHTVNYRNEKVNVEKVEKSDLYHNRRPIDPIVLKTCVFIISFGALYTISWASGRIQYIYVTFGGVSAFSFFPAIVFGGATVIMLISVLRENTEPFITVCKWVSIGIGAICAIYNILNGIFALI